MRMVTVGTMRKMIGKTAIVPTINGLRRNSVSSLRTTAPMRAALMLIGTCPPRR